MAAVLTQILLFLLHGARKIRRHLLFISYFMLFNLADHFDSTKRKQIFDTVIVVFSFIFIYSFLIEDFVIIFLSKVDN